MRHALYASAVLSAFVLSGCGSGISNTSGAQAALPAAPQFQQNAASMKPDVASQPLLYVADSGSGTVKTYLYPSLTYVGQITGFMEPLFLCLGKSNSVFVVDYATGQVSQYAHATSSPIQVLTGLTLPYQCAYDKQTKNLAVVANIESSSEHIGYVAVYHNATGTPHIYYDRDASILTGVAYDSQSNLYVDGYAGTSDTFYYAKLDAPESTFNAIILQGGTPGSAGPMYFDAFNNYIDIGDFATKIYQIPAATPNTVTHIVNVSVPGSTSNGFTVPSLKRVIVADAFENQVLIFKYPHGGTAVNAITTGLNMPWDALVSKP
jgi:hypothetical protein